MTLFVGYGKETAEAVTKSATVAGKGIEAINSEIYAYSKSSIEDAVAATKAVMGSKSVHEAFEFQTDFAKSAFEAYVAELTKISELATATTKDSLSRPSRAACRPGWNASDRRAPPNAIQRVSGYCERAPALASPGPFCFASAGCCRRSLRAQLSGTAADGDK